MINFDLTIFFRIGFFVFLYGKGEWNCVLTRPPRPLLVILSCFPFQCSFNSPETIRMFRVSTAGVLCPSRWLIQVLFIIGALLILTQVLFLHNSTIQVSFFLLRYYRVSSYPPYSKFPDFSMIFS